MLNKKGLTLIEVLIALVITLVLFLALMQTALLSISMNTRNVLRDEAVGIAEMRMREARNLTFTDLDPDTGSLSGASCPTGFPSTGVLVERNLRNITNFNFCTNRTVIPLLPNTDNKQVDIKVGWIWKGEDYKHAVSTIVRRQ